MMAAPRKEGDLNPLRGGSALLLEPLLFCHSFSFRQDLTLGERNFVGKSAAFGTFLEKTKTECFLTFEKTW